MNIQQFKQLLNIGMETALKNEEMLCDLDSKNGDGDLGITFRKIMASLNETIEQRDFDDFGKFLFTAGGDIAENAASTMGTLFATGVMEAGKQLKGVTELTNKEFVIFFQSFINGIEKRGKATRGDKTILDTLYPIVESMSENIEGSSERLFEQALKAAQVAVQETKDLEAKHGRAARYKNKSIGLVDSGSVFAEKFISIFDEYYNKNEIA